MSPYPLDPVRAVGPMRVVVSAYPDAAAARSAARAALARHLAACVSILPIESQYWWKGRVESSAESLALFKTVPKRVGGLIRFLDRGHPYDVPEVIELDVPRVAPRYLAYLAETLDPASPPPPLGGGVMRREGRRVREARAPARTRAPRRRRSR